MRTAGPSRPLPASHALKRGRRPPFARGRSRLPARSGTQYVQQARAYLTARHATGVDELLWETRKRPMPDRDAIHAVITAGDQAQPGTGESPEPDLRPLDGATAGPGYVRVAHDRSLVKHCPAIGTDDVLPAEDEEAVFRHYGLAYQAGAGGERQLARR
jgi:hypothetical protein